jgi:hypothetical protein
MMMVEMHTWSPDWKRVIVVVVVVVVVVGAYVCRHPRARRSRYKPSLEPITCNITDNITVSA